jgi:hypothetical protein
MALMRGSRKKMRRTLRSSGDNDHPTLAGTWWN